MLSICISQLEEIERGWGPELDYGFLSPIFDSISKVGYLAAGFEERSLKLALERSQVPVIALGGITVSKVVVASKMGFGGVAVLGAVWLAADPVSAFEELQEECTRQGPKIG